MRTTNAGDQPSASTTILAPRRTVVRGARVLAMDGRPDDGGIAEVLVEDGNIREVSAARIDVRDAQEIDGTACILLPGFVDTPTRLADRATRPRRGLDAVRLRRTRTQCLRAAVLGG